MRVEIAIAIASHRRCQVALELPLFFPQRRPGGENAVGVAVLEDPPRCWGAGEARGHRVAERPPERLLHQIIVNAHQIAGARKLVERSLGPAPIEADVRSSGTTPKLRVHREPRDHH